MEAKNYSLKYVSFTGAICGVCLVVSLIFAQGAGNYVFTLFDNFSAKECPIAEEVSEANSIFYVVIFSDPFCTETDAAATTGQYSCGSVVCFNGQDCDEYGGPDNSGSCTCNFVKYVSFHVLITTLFL